MFFPYVSILLDSLATVRVLHQVSVFHNYRTLRAEIEFYDVLAQFDLIHEPITQISFQKIRGSKFLAHQEVPFYYIRSETDEESGFDRDVHWKPIFITYWRT